jgi:NADH-quinone oxidoreductase subunit N
VIVVASNVAMSLPPLDNAASFAFALPDLVLAAGIVLVLAVGLISRGLPRRYPAALAVAITIAAVAATLATADGQSRGLFGGLIARDAFADFFKLLAPAAAAIVSLLALRARDAIDFSTAHKDDEAPEFFALILTAALGVQLMAAATDLLMAYLALELVSIMSYVLTGFSRGSRRSAEAALKYVVYGGVASGAMLYGLSLLYGIAGSTSLSAVVAALATAPRPLALVAVALSLAGLGYKVAVVPFHMWCPDVYEGAPTPVAAFLSVAPKAGGFALLMRFFGDPTALAVAADTGAPAPAVPWALLALVVAVLTMTLGNLAALSQRNIKRLLAYSSIAHAGYVFLGLAVGAPAGHQAILFYLGAYLFMNLAAFGVVVAVADLSGGGSDAAVDAERIANWAGLSRRAPLLALVMTIALLALGGLPPSAGFIGKYYLFSALIAAGRAQGQTMYFVAALIAVGNSVVSLYYYLRVIRSMYIDPVPAALGVARAPIAAPLPALLLALVAAIVALGIYWTPLATLSAEALGRWVAAN